MKFKAAKSKPRKKVKPIREEFPPVRMVRRRNGSMVYRVDCRCNGWVGQATYEFVTRKEALDKARSIAASVGVGPTQVYSDHQEQGPHQVGVVFWSHQQQL